MNPEELNAYHKTRRERIDEIKNTEKEKFVLNKKRKRENTSMTNKEKLKNKPLAMVMPKKRLEQKKKQDKIESLNKKIRSLKQQVGRFKRGKMVLKKKGKKKNKLKKNKKININKIIKKRNNNNLSKQKQKQNKKKGIIMVDKKKLIEGRNIFNRKRFNSFSKTTINLFEKNKSKKKLNSNNNRINNKINNNKAQPNSNYLKYVGVLKQNKFIKINNIPKSKVSENDLILSPKNNIKKIKNSFNRITSFKTNENNINYNIKTS